MTICILFAQTTLRMYFKTNSVMENCVRQGTMDMTIHLLFLLMRDVKMVLKLFG